jgi:hypothetical protein
MLTRVLLAALCLLLPSLASSQGVKIVDAEGCISGRPCAYGIPLPKPDRPIYQIDGEGCVVGDPCPWRGWRANRETEESRSRVDPRSGNSYLTTRNPDGTTDVRGYNANTGSHWDQHIDPGARSQSGHNKFGQPWAAGLGIVPEQPRGPWVLDHEPTVVIEPTEFEKRREAFFGRPMNSPSSDSSTDRGLIGKPGGQPLSDDELLLSAEAQRQRERELSTQGVLMKMQPASLVEAARAASRQKCLALADGEARTSCLESTAGK